jgi:hypothetical protein
MTLPYIYPNIHSVYDHAKIKVLHVDKMIVFNTLKYLTSLVISNYTDRYPPYPFISLNLKSFILKNPMKLFAKEADFHMCPFQTNAQEVGIIMGTARGYMQDGVENALIKLKDMGINI